MKTNLEHITKEALVLPNKDRQQLTERLLASFGLKHPTPVSEEEVQARMDSVETGEVKPIPNEEALRKLRSNV